MVKTEQKTIGGHDYTVTQWPATKAMVMKLKTLGFIGKALSLLAQSGSMMHNLMNALPEIMEDVDPVAFIEFIKEVACVAIRDGERMQEAQFDMYFQDGFSDAYQVAFFVLQVNYQDFLELVLNLQKGE